MADQKIARPLQRWLVAGMPRSDPYPGRYRMHRDQKHLPIFGEGTVAAMTNVARFHS
jgi:hypothetical protein